MPAGWTEHDVAARDVVRRYLGNLVPALKDIYGPVVFAKMATILGAADDYPQLTQKPAFAQVPNLFLTDVVKPLTPESTAMSRSSDSPSNPAAIDKIQPPIAALGFNGQWPGPTIRVTQGDKVRAIFTNNIKETTGIHFHGVEFDDFFQDGDPFITQLPIKPGETYTYEFTAKNAGL